MPLTLPTSSSHSTGSEGRLYIVAGPIGNMKDITLRALETLDQVDMIAAEDTRVTAGLLKYHQLKNRLISFHEHNEAKRTPLLIDRLKAGRSLALVTNAGTPSISDPGYRLVKEAVLSRIPVIPVPGPSAVTAAVSISDLTVDTYIYMGFPPRKKQTTDSTNRFGRRTKAFGLL